MSSAAYHATRTAAFIKLPSERALNQAEVVRKLQKESKVDELPDSKRFCAVVIDEMKIREGLVYVKHTGAITGFSTLGDINDELSALANQGQNKSEMPEIGKHMLVIMIRGCFSSLIFLWHFATGDLTGEQIFPIVWEGVLLVESIGLKVICITADGSSHNRKFSKMHKAGNEAYDAVRSRTHSDNTATSSAESVEKQCVTYRTRNGYAPNGDRWIYFISDPPHLIKIRNCLQHSAFGGTRLMTVSWIFYSTKKIMSFFSQVSNLGPSEYYSDALTTMPRTYVHIHMYMYQ